MCQGGLIDCSLWYPKIAPRIRLERLFYESMTMIGSQEAVSKAFHTHSQAEQKPYQEQSMRFHMGSHDAAQVEDPASRHSLFFIQSVWQNKCHAHAAQADVEY